MQDPAVGMEGCKDQQEGWRDRRSSCGDRGMKRLSIGLERKGEEAKGWRYTGMGSEGWRADMEKLKDSRTLMKEDGMKEDGNQLQG